MAAIFTKDNSGETVVPHPHKLFPDCPTVKDATLFPFRHNQNPHRLPSAHGRPMPLFFSD
jgi:hypothetical protein